MDLHGDHMRRISSSIVVAIKNSWGTPRRWLGWTSACGSHRGCLVGVCQMLPLSVDLTARRKCMEAIRPRTGLYYILMYVLVR